MPDLSDTIETVAGEPAEASGDTGSMKQQPIPDLIAADAYLSGKTALEGTGVNGGPKSGWNCLRIARAIPPGTQ